MDMILTGRPVAADEALQIGLANRVVADGTALRAVTLWEHHVAVLGDGGVDGGAGVAATANNSGGGRASAPRRRRSPARAAARKAA